VPIDVFSMLEQDHREVERMLAQLIEVDEGRDRERLVAALTSSLDLHMRFEEARIYPLMAALDEEMAAEAETEHRLARESLDKLAKLSAEPGFGAAVEMLTGVISHHVEDEETEAFPRLRKANDASTLRSLATELLAQQRAAGMMPPASATKDELLHLAELAGIEGRSSMDKEELREALSA
jgi:hemerythrin superfamily protein